MKKKGKKVNPKRQKLIELSRKAKQIMQDIKHPTMQRLLKADKPFTVNNVVMSEFYPEGEYNTYKQWQKLGYQVKKGSKSYTVWSKPIRKTAKANDSDKVQAVNKVLDKGFEVEGDNDLVSLSKYWGIAYLFHESQVEAKADFNIKSDVKILTDNPN